MDYVLLFFAAFFMVGLLGLQSKNVQHSKYVAAAITSMGISLANFVFVKAVAVGGYDTLLVVMVNTTISRSGHTLWIRAPLVV